MPEHAPINEPSLPPRLSSAGSAVPPPSGPVTTSWRSCATGDPPRLPDARGRGRAAEDARLRPAEHRPLEGRAAGRGAGRRLEPLPGHGAARRGVGHRAPPAARARVPRAVRALSDARHSLQPPDREGAPLPHVPGHRRPARVRTAPDGAGCRSLRAREAEYFLGLAQDKGQVGGKAERGYHATAPFVFGEGLRRKALSSSARSACR